MGIERISEFWPSWKPLELLGKGGNGEVYKCIHEEMGVKTYSAIKVINISSRQMNTFAFDTGEIRSFCRNLINDCVNEINVMLSLKNCQNIVCIEDFKVVEIVKDEEWEIFIRMEMLTCLTDYLRGRALTQDEVLKLGIDLCTALELCHSKNIMHRDIKPANIFVNEFGVFKLGDFGIARTLEMATAGLSRKGTVTYIAPEVMYSNDYTKAVDIYSLGLVLYQLANNNRIPFLPVKGEYTHVMQNDAINKRLGGAELPSACNADEAFNSILRIACEFRPENRFQSVEQMKDAVNQIVNPNFVPEKKIKHSHNEDTTVKVVRKQDPPKAENKKNNTMMIALAVVAVVCAIATAVSVILVFLSRKTDDNNPDNTVQVNVEEEAEAAETEENRPDENTLPAEYTYPPNPYMPATTYPAGNGNVNTNNANNQGNANNSNNTNNANNTNNTNNTGNTSPPNNTPPPVSTTDPVNTNDQSHNTGTDNILVDNTKAGVIAFYKKAHTKVLSEARSVTKTFVNNSNYKGYLEVGGNTTLAKVASTLMGMFLKANYEQVVYTGSAIATNFPPTMNSCAGLTADMIGGYSIRESGNNYIITLTINSTEASPDYGSKSKHLVNIFESQDIEDAAAGFVGFSGLRIEYIAPTITATINKSTGRMVELSTDTPAYMKFDSATVVSIINVPNVGVGVRSETKWTIQW